MKIPTVEYLKSTMTRLGISHLDLALLLEVSERTLWRMTSPEKPKEKLRLKDRCCIAFLLVEIEDEQHLIADFCNCNDPEQYFNEQLGYDICLACMKKLKGKEKNK